MKTDQSEVFDNLVVVKRSGQRTSFQGEKIALAIKKAFDSVEGLYTTETINKVYSNILKIIETRYVDRKTIKIEDIQDIIEEQLQKLHFHDVYESFKNYRDQRSLSREAFVVKQQHKFLKAIETLGLNSYTDANTIIDRKNSKEVLLTFGHTIAEEFSKAYLLDTKTIRSLDSSLFELQDIAYISMGTTASMQWDLERIFRLDFVKQQLSSEMDIYEYTQFIYRLLKENQKDQYGSQSLESLDHVFAPLVLKTFQSVFEKHWTEQLEITGFSEFIKSDQIQKETLKWKHLPLLEECFQEFTSPVFQHLLQQVYHYVFEDTYRFIKQAFLLFFQNINSLCLESKLQRISLSLGTNDTLEGQMITKIILEIFNEHPEIEYPECFFKIRSSFHFETEQGQGLLTQSLTCPKIYYVFLDTKENNKFYQTSYTTEIGYLSLGERVYEDMTPGEPNITGGKGTLSFAYLNLPRIALKVKDTPQSEKMTLFYQELDETLDLLIDAMLERFELQCSKHCYNFPFLIEKGIWLDGEKVKPNDRLRKVLKHGTLSVGFAGLEQTVSCLKGERLEDLNGYELGLEIMNYLDQKVKEYSAKNNLNFVLSGIENLEYQQKFLEIDKAIYGKIKGVTDVPYYNCSFQFHTKKQDPYYLEKIGNFQKLTPGGHLLVLEGKTISEKLKFLRLAMEKQIGCCIFKQN